MGYYVEVQEDVKIYVEDLNPKSKKTIVFLHGCPEVISSLNTNLISYQDWVIGVLE
jgi:hypothetical protein